jgi:hypothetical protein
MDFNARPVFAVAFKVTFPGMGSGKEVWPPLNPFAQKLTQSLVEPILRKRGIARQRKLAELRRLLPAANVKIAYKSILEISWLSPTAPIIANPQHQGEQQDCGLVSYLIAWPPTARSIVAHSAWAAEIPDHAAARLLEY